MDKFLGDKTIYEKIYVPGQVFVPVETLQEKKPIEQWYPLMPSEKKTEMLGQVHLRFTYTPKQSTISITGTKFRRIFSSRK